MAPHLPAWPPGEPAFAGFSDAKATENHASPGLLHHHHHHPPPPPPPRYDDVEMGSASTSTSSGTTTTTTAGPPVSSPRPRTCSMWGAGPALGTPPPGAPPATALDLPPDLLRTILALLEPGPAKRDLARVCTAWRDALASPASWPGVDLHPVTVASCAWLARVLAGPGGGRVAVTVRCPVDEAAMVAFHDVCLSSVPASLEGLTVHMPWQTAVPFAHLWWALRHQRRLGALALRGGCVDVAALPLGPGSGLGRLAIECTSLDNFEALAAGASHLTALDLSVWPALGGPASAAAARPPPGGRASVEPRLAHHGSGGGLDTAPLAALTSLRSLSLNTHPWALGPAAALWTAGLAAMARLTSLTLAAAPGFAADLALPPACGLRLSSRGCLPPAAPSYGSLVSLSLRDLASPAFDASPLATCARLAALDVSFAAETGCVLGLAGLTSLTSLKAGCSALRLVLPPLPRLCELEAVAFSDLELLFSADGMTPALARPVATALARSLASSRGSVYLAALSFDVGVQLFTHSCGKAGLDLHFATRPLRAVFTADQCVDGGGGGVGGGEGGGGGGSGGVLVAEE